MTPERWQEVAEAFEAVVEVKPEGEGRVSENLNSGDPSLASEAKILLAEDALRD